MLERLGHTQYEPYVEFSIPLGAENVRGWLAFTYDAGAEREATGSVFGNATYYRQNTPCYPYVDMVDTFSSFFGSRSFLRSVHYVI